MTRTADDIKKGLENCVDKSNCGWCPRSFDCKREDDALAYIKQLEAERDAAVKDIRLAFTMHLGACNTCLYFEERLACDAVNICALCEDKECVCNNCDKDCSNWQWRGIQKEELNDANV